MPRLSRIFLVALLCGGACFADTRPASAQIGGPIGAPVIFRPKPGTTLSIEGRGPFRGTLELRREGNGVTLINELGLDDYVMGIREVPGKWPMEALKAQAVAARTYALWERERGYWQQFGFDVCGTTACQVYQGADAEADERGRRWVEAVKSTAGEVLLHDGQPALTRYHASSGGRTLPNELVYPSDGVRAYLKSIEDPFDRVSPLHRWTVTFPRADLERILKDGIGLAGTLDEVRANQTTRRLEIRTLGGELEISTVRFRTVVSEHAPRLFPSRYPASRSDGQRMPMTMPSSRFTVTKTDDAFVLRGMGYGHGVGMSQWGAMGRATEGHDYDEILAAYYGGLKPQRWTGPRTMRVALTRGTASARVSGNGDFSVSAGSDVLSESTLGGWTVTPTALRSLQVAPPAGYNVPLVLTAINAPDDMLVDPDRDERLSVDFVVPKPAEITATLTRDDEQVARSKAVVEAGERTVEIPLDAEKLGGKHTYRLDVGAFDGTKTVSASRDITIEGPGPGLLRRAGFATVVALVLFFWWRRRRPDGRPPPDQVRSTAAAAVERSVSRRP